MTQSCVPAIAYGASSTVPAPLQTQRSVVAVINPLVLRGYHLYRHVTHSETPRSAHTEYLCVL